jgi:hypothetical protein
MKPILYILGLLYLFPVSVRGEITPKPNHFDQSPALILYDGTSPGAISEYGIEVTLRKWPYGESTYECIISVSKVYSGKMSPAVLSVSEILKAESTIGSGYNLSATLNWKPENDVLRLRLVASYRENFRQTIILPFSQATEGSIAIRGVEVDLTKLLREMIQK